jgi:hypothetical protein
MSDQQFFLDAQRNLPEMENRILDGLYQKEQPRGDLCQNFLNSTEILIPVTILMPNLVGRNIVEVDRENSYITYAFFHRDFPLKLNYGDFSPARLYLAIQRAFFDQKDKSKDLKREFSDLVYLIEQYIYGDNGVEVDYKQMLTLHDLGSIFKGTICSHLLDRSIDLNCEICQFR